MPTLNLSPNQLLALLGGALALCLAAMLLWMYQALRVTARLRALEQLVTTHDDLLGGGAGVASTRLASLEAHARESEGKLDAVGRRTAQLEERSTLDLSQVGFLRYDAFADTGSDLSYALALLNREGDGVVLNSIYSRTETRTYGKAVRGFTCESNASDEENAAIARAKSA